MCDFKINIFLLGLFSLLCTFEINGQIDAAIDIENLSKLIEVSKETFTDEIMVIYKNEVVSHWKNEDCDTIFFNTASMVKSWTGLVVGILIDKGIIASEDDLACKYIPEWEEGCKNKITIKNLLTMTSGINRRSGAQSIMAADDTNLYALKIKPDTMPNIRFNYSNESVQLLGIIIEKVSGKSANDCFDELLFGPLEMNASILGKDPVGNNVVFGGAKTSIADAAKIGLLMANKGQYKNKQLVSSDWIQKSITPSQNAPYYGYLWWLDNNSNDKNYAATGDFGQMTIVFPELELIYLRQQSCNKDISGNMTWMGPNFLTLVASVVKKSDR